LRHYATTAKNTSCYQVLIPSILSACPDSNSKWARRSRSVVWDFGLVPSVSVLADFALLGGRLFQGENTNTGLLFPLTFQLQLPHFGWRMHPITGNPRLHTGTDPGALLGTPVCRCYAGNVALADFVATVDRCLRPSNLPSKRFMVTSQKSLSPGEWVEQGSVIGRVGSSNHWSPPPL